MATVVLQVVGAAIGGAVGGPVGATIGRAIGAAAGYAIDQQIFQKDRVITGPRLQSTRFTSSAEGAAIPRIYGRVRVGAEIIWATRFKETNVQSSQGGKGGPSTTVNEFAYSCSFAAALCEGPISYVGRIWADGTELDLTKLNFRVYNGEADQAADPLIDALQGSANTPAYRGLAYVVFEDLQLANFGNRIPQLSFEVIRAVGKLEKDIRSVCMIPGATAFGYAPDPVKIENNSGATELVNRHVLTHRSDWAASLDELQALCPNLKNISLVTTWFGTDLRAQHCQFKPGIEHQGFTSADQTWSVNGTTTATAHLISQADGKVAFGSTPSDFSIIRAIQDIHARGLEVTFYPFVMMDIPDGNQLPDPYGGAEQATYPWRGEITCDPAIGETASADQTLVAATQINALVGDAVTSDFTVDSNEVIYSGMGDWGYRRMVLHYAHLCAAAGGVERFIIGSELRGLTSIRDEQDAFPFVDALCALADDVKSVLPPTSQLTYAADWSEYFGYHPADGSADVFFNLDKLWARNSISAVGIDCYFPLSDWRQSGDAVSPEINQYSASDLRANMVSGEGYDWYYESTSNRRDAVRTPITDGLGEEWIWRYKDIKSWWLNAHHERVGGVRNQVSSDWLPQQKPIWFTETGCPAINKGANQPNVFFDAKSSSSGAPYFSSADRDDLIQRRYLEAFVGHWNETNPNLDHDSPISSVYNGRMVDTDHVSIWAWDARPYPAFPNYSDIWSDGINWNRGHWLNGRLGSTPLDDLIETLLGDYGFHAAQTGSLDGWVDGFAVPHVASARSSLEILLSLFSSNAVADNETLHFFTNSNGNIHELGIRECVMEGEKFVKSISRDAAQSLPEQIVIHHDTLSDKVEASANKSQRLENGSGRQFSVELPAVLPPEFAKALANNKMRDYWSEREKLQLTLPPQRLEFQVGDILKINDDPVAGNWQINAIEDAAGRELVLSRERKGNDLSFPLREGDYYTFDGQLFGKPLFVLLDLPHASGSIDPSPQLLIATSADPFAGGYAIASSPNQDGFAVRATTARHAAMARISGAVSTGPIGRWDNATKLVVSPINGALTSKLDAALFNGENLAALECTNGGWEIIQFANADPNQDGTWTLSKLLRSQSGTDPEMAIGIKPDGLMVLLDQQLQKLELEAFEKNLLLNWRIGPIRDAVSSDSFAAQSFTFSNSAQRPLSPVHLFAKRNSADDLEFKWIRRSRVDGDNWEVNDIPLGEIVETYQVTVGDGTVDLRTFEVGAATAIYQLADQIADHGSPLNSGTVRVTQIGSGGITGAANQISF